MTHMPSDRDETPARPRWVRVSVAIVAVIVVLAIVIALLAGGEHGPGRHTSLGGTPDSLSL